MLKTATVADVASDPHLELLLVFLLGRDTTEEHASTMIKHSTQGAAALLQSKPFYTAFDDYADRPDVYSLVSNTVEALLEQPTSDPELQRQRASALVAIRGVREDGSNELHIAGGNPGGLGQSVLMDHATAGMLLGAAIMYQLLKGGAK